MVYLINSRLRLGLIQIVQLAKIAALQSCLPRKKCKDSKWVAVYMMRQLSRDFSKQANSIRTFLRRGGVSETVLNQFNDEALIRMFQEAQQAPSVSSSEQTVGDGNSSALPQNPTPQEIRDLLKSAGMDEDMLKKFDDATLLRLYRETLMDVNKNQN